MLWYFNLIEGTRLVGKERWEIEHVVRAFSILQDSMAMSWWKNCKSSWRFVGGGDAVVSDPF